MQELLPITQKKRTEQEKNKEKCEGNDEEGMKFFWFSHTSQVPVLVKTDLHLPCMGIFEA